MKTHTLWLQLVLVTVLVAIIGTHFSTLWSTREHFFAEGSPMGIAGEDQTVLMNGIIATTGESTLGKSKIPDVFGNILLIPNGNGVTKVSGKLIVDGQLCFRDGNCFGSKAELKGDKGDRGDRGLPGVKGDTGATGPVGPQGPAGPAGGKGDKGDKGDRGERGLQGANGIGLTGPQGPAGPRGPQGDRGPAGFSTFRR